MKNKSFMEEVEEYCELLLKCVKNDELSDELAKELINRKNRIAKLYKKEQREGTVYSNDQTVLLNEILLMKQQKNAKGN